MMYASVETITVNLAKHYLSLNTNNYRKQISNKRVSAYAREMAAGNWETNGEPIKFREDGTLFDGQHRLWAVVKSGVPITVVVVRGVPNETVICDVGKKRTVREHALAAGISKRVAENTVLALANLFVDSGSFGASSVEVGNVIDFTKRYETMLETVVSICYKGKNSTNPARKSCVLLAAFVLLAENERQSELSDFFKIVCTGFSIPGTESSPAIVLRNALLDKNNAPKNISKKQLLYSMTISAFYDFKNGIKRMRPYKMNYDHLELLETVRKKLL